eukprot:Hpha_TRINITY_DN5070_c0_g1::TRINITY_DN5070_c0_g1_i2::g.94218::m.94218
MDTEQLGQLTVITVHFTLSDDARLHSAWELCQYARLMQRKGSGTVLLTGDLNMEPDDPAMQYLIGEHTYQGDTCDFRDVWLLPGKREHDLEGEDGVETERGVTFNNLEGRPHKRIDFVLARGEVPDDAFFSVEVIGGKQRQPGSLAPSDHLGLRVLIEHQRWRTEGG